MGKVVKKIRRKFVIVVLLIVGACSLFTITLQPGVANWRHGFLLVSTGSEDISESQQWQINLIQQSKSALAAGHETNKKKKLVIGIASSYRVENYLNRTLHSLLTNSDVHERKETIVVIYLSDSNRERNDRQLAFIQREFREHLDSGFFQVILAVPSIYPSMEFAKSKRTYNDSLPRVQWRTKQVIDFTFLFTYAQHMAEYYLVLEDDVIASEHYISAILDFIEVKKNKRWIVLQFTEFLAIGLLFRNIDLPKLIQFLWMFHQEQPVDLLMHQFIDLQVPEKNVHVKRIPSVFQHIGTNSTLKDKIQKLTDKSFNIALRKYKNHRNPPAKISTSMTVYREFFPDYAYKMAPGYFWGTPSVNSTYLLTFRKAVNVTRFVAFSGILNSKGKMVDPIEDGTVEMGYTHTIDSHKQSLETGSCNQFIPVAKFHNAQVDVSGTFPGVKCIRIVIGDRQKLWVIIREVQVFIMEVKEAHSRKKVRHE